MRAGLFVLLCTASCGGLTEDPPGDDGERDARSVEQQEVWTARDNPSVFDDNIERRLADLPSSGKVAREPWPGPYWPTWQDSINDRWAGGRARSPAAKYGSAFGVANAETMVSRYHGIDSRGNDEACDTSSDCDASLGEKCGKRDGRSSGRCMPTWYGLCHAWAAASILLPEPQHAVVKNGVRFEVQDIKALISLVHNSTTSRFVSARCEQSAAAGSVSFDADGRPTAACRDTNPGTFHTLVANYIGIRKQAFIMDRTFDNEVWNQPIRSFKVIEQRSVDGEEANRAIGVRPVGGATASDAGTLTAHGWSRPIAIQVQPGKSYVVLMTGTGDADLYVRFGAPPTATEYKCRPYREGSMEECAGKVPSGSRIMYAAAHGGGERSKFSITMAAGSIPSDYTFNPSAADLVLVKTELSYVVNSEPGTDGPLTETIDQYARTETYNYVLELDRQGVIIGGEWAGNTKRSHPDFLWLPSGPSGALVAGGAIKYNQVKELVDASVEPE